MQLLPWKSTKIFNFLVTTFLYWVHYPTWQVVPCIARWPRVLVMNAFGWNINFSSNLRRTNLEDSTFVYQPGKHIFDGCVFYSFIPGKWLGNIYYSKFHIVPNAAKQYYNLSLTHKRHLDNNIFFWGGGVRQCLYSAFRKSRFFIFSLFYTNQKTCRKYFNFFTCLSWTQQPKKYSEVEKILEGHLLPLCTPSFAYAYTLLPKRTPSHCTINIL